MLIPPRRFGHVAVSFLFVNGLFIGTFGLKGHIPVVSKLFCKISKGIEFQALMIDDTVKYLALAVSLREDAFSLTAFERRNDDIFNLNVDATTTS